MPTQNSRKVMPQPALVLLSALGMNSYSQAAQEICKRESGKHIQILLICIADLPLYAQLCQYGLHIRFGPEAF